ncbi:hypothetical protein JMUB7526_28520 [Staphylococcus aureus]
MDFIEQKEFGTRGLYGAPVGYIDIYDDCEFIVAIRSMLIKKAQATLFAGCGICLLYTSPSPRDMRRSRMPSSA